MTKTAKIKVLAGQLLKAYELTPEKDKASIPERIKMYTCDLIHEIEQLNAPQQKTKSITNKKPKQ